MSCAIKLLPYCVAHDPAPLLATGVKGAPVQTMNVDILQCVYSPLIPPQEFTREDALSFHSVLKPIFEQQAIIPFRFPTILQNEAELHAHLREKRDLYSGELERLKDAVQMEVRIAGKPEPASAPTGAEYLRSKQQHSQAVRADAKKVRTALADLVLEWKEQPAESGLRCYALVRRAAAADFSQALATAEFESPNSIVVSGPWPATEFLHD